MASWRAGDPPGPRRFLDLPAPLPLEAGGSLPAVRFAYETWGELAPDGSNAVLVCHALTADSHVSGDGGWWGDVVGPGCALDTDRWYVVAPNVLGGCQGTTGPSSPAPDGARWGSRWPTVTVRDQVRAEVAFADALGIGRWAAVLGGSMGGMRALEWALMHPDRVGGLLALACPAAASADQIGWCGIQLAAIRSDPQWRGGDYLGDGPVAGLGLARRIAHATYRSEAELQVRFGREPQAGEDPWAGGRYAVESYLDHHAAKLVARFDASSYVALTESMNGHDAGRGRGGIPAALGALRDLPDLPVVVAGVDSDRLYPLHQQQELADGIGVPLEVVHSDHGHDGFLLESGQIGALLKNLLDRV